MNAIENSQSLTTYLRYRRPLSLSHTHICSTSNLQCLPRHPKLITNNLPPPKNPPLPPQTLIPNKTPLPHQLRHRPPNSRHLPPRHPRHRRQRSPRRNLWREQHLPPRHNGLLHHPSLHRHLHRRLRTHPLLSLQSPSKRRKGRT